MNTNQQRIGVIGLGNMGGAIVEGLINCGYEVNVYDLNESAVARLVSEGAIGKKTIEDIAESSNVILTSLPNSNAVKGVYLGEKGLVATVNPGTIIVELSTIEPETVKEVERLLNERDANILDVPVSGSPAEAKKGNLKLIAAGDELLLHAVKPILSAFGEVIKHVGPVGNAKTIKIVNNLMTMGNVIVAAEAFAMGVKAGVEPNLLFNVLNQSGGRSHHFDKRFPNALKRDFSPGFTVDLGEKDVGLAIQLAHDLNIPTPVAGIVKQMYGVAMSEGLAREDIVSVLKLYEKWGNIIEEDSVSND